MKDKTRDELLLALARWITEGGPAAFAALHAAKVNFIRAQQKDCEVMDATDKAEC